MGRNDGEQFRKSWVLVEALALARALELVREAQAKRNDPELAGAWVAESLLCSESGMALERAYYGECLFNEAGEEATTHHPGPEELGVDVNEFLVSGERLAEMDFDGRVNAPGAIEYLEGQEGMWGRKGWWIVRTYEFTFNDVDNFPILKLYISLGKRERGGAWERVFEHLLKTCVYTPLNGPAKSGRALLSGLKLRLHYWKLEENGQQSTVR